MKTHAILVMIWSNEVANEVARLVAERFEKLNDIPVRIITDKDLNNEFLSSACFARYHGWKFVPEDTERLIHLDADMLPLRPLPKLPDVDFAAAPATPKAYKGCAEMWPIIERAGVYFNMGLFVARRSPVMERIFKRMLLRQNHEISGAPPWYWDQTLMNVEIFSAAEAGKLTYSLLPRTCNYLTFDPDPISTPCMWHLVTGTLGRARILGHALNQIKKRERVKG